MREVCYSRSAGGCAGLRSFAAGWTWGALPSRIKRVRAGLMYAGAGALRVMQLQTGHTASIEHSRHEGHARKLVSQKRAHPRRAYVCRCAHCACCGPRRAVPTPSSTAALRAMRESWHPRSERIHAGLMYAGARALRMLWPQESRTASIEHSRPEGHARKLASQKRALSRRAYVCRCARVARDAAPDGPYRFH